MTRSMASSGVTPLTVANVQPAALAKRHPEREQHHAAAHVADRALAHAVHHVGERHAGVEVDDRERSAVAAPETRARVRAERQLRDRQPEPDAVAQRDRQREVRAVRLLVEHRLDALRRQEPHAVGLAAAGHRRVHERDRPSVGVPAGGRDLGPPPRDRVGVGGRERRVPIHLVDERVGAPAASSSSITLLDGGMTWATRASCSGAVPMWKSTPSGPVTSFAANSPIVCPVTRRRISPSR